MTAARHPALDAADALEQAANALRRLATVDTAAAAIPAPRAPRCGDDLLSLREVEAQCGTSTWTVRAAIRSGVLAHERGQRGRYEVRRGDLERWLGVQHSEPKGDLGELVLLAGADLDRKMTGT